MTSGSCALIYMNPSRWQGTILPWARSPVSCVCIPQSLNFSLPQSSVYTSELLTVQIRSDQSLSRVQLFETPWIAARQASLSITNSQSSLRLTSMSQWRHPAISSSVVTFSSCPQSLPASESFPMSQIFAWGGQSTGISALASFLPKKSQGWSPSKWGQKEARGCSDTKPLFFRSGNLSPEKWSEEKNVWVAKLGDSKLHTNCILSPSPVLMPGD